MTTFLLQAMFISLSGVMAPGPLSAAIVGRGQRAPHAGALMAIGHGVFEFPLMGLVLLGFGPWVDAPYVRPVVASLGGVVLLWMGASMLRGLRGVAAATTPHADGRSALVTGIVLTAANPYFLIWWLSVGAALLLRATEYGPGGVLAFAVAHWLCDLGWFWLLSAAAYGGGRLLGAGFQRLVLLVCGLFLLVMGADFLRDAYTRLG